jgi:SPW repeat
MMGAKWQDWVSFALGLWLALSPWIAGYAEHAGATADAVTAGLVLALASHFECVASEEQLPIEWLNLAVGGWLVGAPLVIDFASRVAANSIAVGVSIFGLAAFALSLDKRFGRLWHGAR